MAIIITSQRHVKVRVQVVLPPRGGLLLALDDANRRVADRARPRIRINSTSPGPLKLSNLDANLLASLLDASNAILATCNQIFLSLSANLVVPNFPKRCRSVRPGAGRGGGAVAVVPLGVLGQTERLSDCAHCHTKRRQCKMKSVLITGCNRGLGLGLVQQLVQRSTPPKHLIATCRNPQQAQVRGRSPQSPTEKTLQPARWPTYSLESAPWC